MAPIISARGGLSSAAYGQFSAALAGGSYESIATVSVGSGGQSSITFSSIPSTYKHLQIRAIYKLNSGSQYCSIRFNGDNTASNYSLHLLNGDGSSVSAGGGANAIPYVAQSGSTANIFGTSIIDILDYSSVSKAKTVRALVAQDRNGSGDINLTSGAWYNTSSAINSFTIIPNNSAIFSELSQFALYGIKGA